jgi:acyl-CoA hydrolase
MEVGVKVFAEDLRRGEKRHVASAYLTFVALDDLRQPVPVPPLVPANEEEIRRFEQAGARRAYRLAHRNRNQNMPPAAEEPPS